MSDNILSPNPNHIDTPMVAVVGCGNWGKNLVRNFHNLGHLEMLCDLDPKILATMRQDYGNLTITDNYQTVLDNPDVHGVVISTPSITHYKLAKQALLAGKHVYVEKPIATTGNETVELFTIAHELDKVLMVGHLLMYHPAVLRLKQLIEEDVLGQIKNIQSDRLNTNLNRPDKSVLWDLAPHDISMVSHLLGESPEEIVSAVGYKSQDDGLVDDAHLDFVFPNDVAGHIHVSWVHPVKQVKLIVRGTKHTAMIDDTQASSKLKLFAAEDETNPIEEFPEYLGIEPLKLECQHFINCLRYNKQARSDGMNGYRVVKLLEQAEEQIELISV